MAVYADMSFDNIYIQSAVEMAMWDLAGKVYGLPLYRLLGGPYRKEIELAACMGIQTYERAGEIARLYVEMGFTTLKTKAGPRPRGGPRDGPGRPGRRRRPARAPHRPQHGVFARRSASNSPGTSSRTASSTSSSRCPRT